VNDSQPTRRVWIVNEPFDLPDHSRSYRKGERVLDDEATATTVSEQKFRAHASPTIEPDHDAIAAAAADATPQKTNGKKSADAPADPPAAP